MGWAEPGIEGKDRCMQPSEERPCISKINPFITCRTFCPTYPSISSCIRWQHFVLCSAQELQRAGVLVTAESEVQCLRSNLWSMSQSLVPFKMPPLFDNDSTGSGGRTGHKSGETHFTGSLASLSQK